MASWIDLEKYLQRHGWNLVRQHGRDKIYEKLVSENNIVRTKVSKSSGEIGKDLFRKILKQQLGITKEEFNA